MRKFTIIIIYFFAYQVSAQIDENVLRDTVQFMVQRVESLQCVEYEQSMLRLNFDDCNLEVHQTPRDDPDKWNVYSFWLPTLNEKEMKLLQQPSEEWSLILKSEGQEIQFDRDTGSGHMSHVVIFGEDRQSLIAIGQAMFYATQQCKGLDRFKK